MITLDQYSSVWIEHCVRNNYTICTFHKVIQFMKCLIFLNDATMKSSHIVITDKKPNKT